MERYPDNPGAVQDQVQSPSRSLVLTLLVAGALLFILYPTNPLFYGNQNTKFLHGMAQAGLGHLNEDWQANTTDPLVPFSFLVYLTSTFLHPVAYHIYQYLTFVLYAGAVLFLGRAAAGPAGESRRFTVVLLILFVAMQSTNATETLWDGVAKQYIVDSVFQPSSFGVLLLWATVLFVQGRGGWIPAFIGLAAWMHPAYVIPGLILLGSMAVAGWRAQDPRIRLDWRVILGGSVLCVASAAFVYGRMPPTSPELAERASWIIARVRIPHHSDPTFWSAKVDTLLKLGLVCGGIWTQRGKPLGRIMAVSLAAIVGLTALTILRRDDQLAITAPWRASAYLVPMVWAVLLGRFVGWALPWAAEERGRRRAGAAMLACLTVVACVAGLSTKYKNFLLRTQPDYFTWVRDHVRPGDVFLTDPAETDFRLATLAPQFVSWKSHPYRDTEVIEWYERLQLAETITRKEPFPCEAVPGVAENYLVTHLVLPAGRSIDGCRLLIPVYEGTEHRIVVVGGAAGTGVQ